ncbi:MAG: alpha-amylase family glycosyl hydrolase [Bacteroidales bacterium]|jgi:cyclomaltodextrinase|nr:alpha-amylase family glycosyl hydrolase [Bacteroidales bacterium]
MKNVLIFIGLIGFGLLIQACDNQVDSKSTEEAKIPVEWSKNAVIYEVNVRQYTEEGTFKAFEAELPRLKELGIDILWMMPIHPIGLLNRKGGLGSYYSIQDYTAVNPEFGTMEDMQSLIAKTHELGMYIILDWVANHSAWDHAWVTEHPEYYAKDSTGAMISPFDWTDVVAFDYDDDGLREAMKKDMLFWIRDMDIDGFRCDVAGEVPTDFWEDVRSTLDEVKPVFMLAEAEKSELVEKAFDMDYGWHQHHLMNQIAKGDIDANEMNAYFDKLDKEYAERSYKLYFTSNHDENSWNGTVEERLGDAADVLSVLSFTVGDMPLIYNGQESGLNKRLLFFEKDQIDWEGYSKTDFFKKLTSLKHTEEALWSGTYGERFVRISSSADEQIFAFDRGNVRVILNLSDEDKTFSLKNVDFEAYETYMQKGFDANFVENEITLTAWGYAVIIK